MVDFNKLKKKSLGAKPLDPLEIFRRLPKPPGINDLYSSQAEALKAWFERRADRDVVLKLHTGGGKTLVGLLMAQSTLNELHGPVLYLAPTVQLVSQTLEKARGMGIEAVPYRKGVPLADDFVNGSAIMVATYNALFNGRSKFGLRGEAKAISASAVILDDAHAAFSVVRDSFTLNINREDHEELYDSVASEFREAFKGIDRLGTFDDITSGAENGVLEVPYWAWHEKIELVRRYISEHKADFSLVWPLLRDRLHLCHALLTRNSFVITPILPFVDSFPTFFEAKRRIFMSATIADDSDIIRTFDAEAAAVGAPIASRSLAGVSERMILIPDLMPFSFNVRDAIEKVADWAANKKKGAVVLAPSDKAASSWEEVGIVAKGSQEVEALVAEMQRGATFGPAVFANRYDGIDLPGDSCRLLVMSGLPAGTSSYELFRASALHGGVTITRMLAQRIEQGIGRGARGSGDYCVVLMEGADLAGWVAKEANFRFLTCPTRAQMEIGAEVSREVNDLPELAETISRSFNRDSDWVGYHADRLAELVSGDEMNDAAMALAKGERKALNLWADGYNEKAISRIERTVKEVDQVDPHGCGWLEQIGARIADNWEANEKAEDLQRQAFARNRNLLRPKVLPPYRPLHVASSQAQAICAQIEQYRMRRGFLQEFESTTQFLSANSSAQQFERSMEKLGRLLGFEAERHDNHGQGPDVLWLLPDGRGVIIEAKSRKSENKPLTKGEHGQLLVAAEWFAKNYPGQPCLRVSVHPSRFATKAADAHGSYALSSEGLEHLVTAGRQLFKALCECHLCAEAFATHCESLLEKFGLRAQDLPGKFFRPFLVQEE